MSEILPEYIVRPTEQEKDKNRSLYYLIGAVLMLLSIFIIYSVIESYYFITDNVIPILIFMIVYPIWAITLKNQSVMIGSKNIIIGKYRIPYDLVQSVSLEKKSVLIKTDEQSFEINNWAMGKGRCKLEQVLKQINLI